MSSPMMLTDVVDFTDFGPPPLLLLFIVDESPMGKGLPWGTAILSKVKYKSL